MRPNTLIVLLGPTGVGKTELSLQLAEQLGSPILSADSRQLYRDLPIGTAAPTPEQQIRVKHHFVGTLELTDYYSAARYEEDAIDLLEQLFIAHPSILMTGGSMMYIDAVCNGIDDLPTVDVHIRNQLMEQFKNDGLDKLCEKLQQLDPVYYDEVDLKNHKRVLHALEICYMTGKPYSLLRTRTIKERPFNIIKIGLTRDRAELYDRINRRVDQMIDDGLLEEARAVYKHRDYNSLNTVGYKELFAYFDGTCTLPEAIEKIKQHSRIYSRKQMTWFKRDTQINWFHPEETDRLKKFINEQV